MAGNMFREIKEMHKNNFHKDISDIPYELYRKQFTGEEFEKLTKEKPKTIFAASRLPGIRPTTLLYLQYLQGKHCEEEGKKEEEING
jgi:tRNA U34 5-carboxymethylaminomethyl modifying enzyme MnmG/GidA